MTKLAQLWTAIIAWFDAATFKPGVEAAPTTATDDDARRRAVQETTREQLDWYHWSHHTPI